MLELFFHYVMNKTIKSGIIAFLIFTFFVGCQKRGKTFEEIKKEEIYDIEFEKEEELLKDKIDIEEEKILNQCVKFNPDNIDFGKCLINDVCKRSVEIVNCGEKLINIFEIFIAMKTDPEFSLDLSTLSKIPPLEILPLKKEKFDVLFSPEQIKKKNSLWVYSKGKVIIKNDVENESVINLKGLNYIHFICEATIVIKEGDSVPVNTVIHLIGSHNTHNDGISEFYWSMLQPPGGNSVFEPSEKVPDPIMKVTVKGKYTFFLEFVTKLNEICKGFEVLKVY